MVFYTDALIESKDGQGRQLGEGGLLDMARSLDATQPETFAPSLLARVAQFRGGVPADDDETILLLHHNAADPPALSFKERLKVLGRVLGLMDDHAS